MHPTLIVDLATERHAELLRYAEARRRTAPLRTRTPPSRPATLAGHLQVALAAMRRRAGGQPSVQNCCA